MKKFEKPNTEKMRERKLGLNIFRPDWKKIYTHTMKSLKYKKFAKFRYKVLVKYTALLGEST